MWKCAKSSSNEHLMFPFIPVLVIQVKVSIIILSAKVSISVCILLECVDCHDKSATYIYCYSRAYLFNDIYMLVAMS
jgi:hypothetical protein